MYFRPEVRLFTFGSAGATRPLWGIGVWRNPWRPNSRATPQHLDQRSKKGMRDNPGGGESDPAEGVRRRCMKNSPSVLSCIDKRRLWPFTFGRPGNWTPDLHTPKARTLILRLLRQSIILKVIQNNRTSTTVQEKYRLVHLTKKGYLEAEFCHIVPKLVLALHPTAPAKI